VSADPKAALAWADVLRQPFERGLIGKLPKATCRACTDARGKVCGEHAKSKCPRCGNYMTTAHIDLDYVGHAAVTDRLLDVDPGWTWEPLALDCDGLPAYDRSGGLWIRLTVCGVSRLGYGDGPDPKQRIGDAIRNAAMRFGVALDLWHKGGDLHDDYADPPDPPPIDPPVDPRAALRSEVAAAGRAQDMDPDAIAADFEGWSGGSIRDADEPTLRSYLAHLTGQDGPAEPDAAGEDDETVAQRIYSAAQAEGTSKADLTRLTLECARRGLVDHPITRPDHRVVGLGALLDEITRSRTTKGKSA
jgi:hypothetical protein